MNRLLIIGFFIGITQCLIAQERILNNFSTKLEEKGVGVKLKSGIPSDIKIEEQDKTIQLAFELGYLIVFDSNDKEINNIIAALSETYSWVYSQSKKYIFLIPKPFYSTTEDLDYFLDGSLADTYIMKINDWYNISKEIDSLINVANTLNRSIGDKNEAYKSLKKIVDSLESRKLQLINEDGIADQNLRTVGLGKQFLDEYMNGDEDPKKYFEKILNLVKNIRIREVKDYKTIKENDPFLKAYEDLFTKLNKDKFPYFNEKTVDNPYLHPELANAINEINKKEKDKLTKMGVYPLTVIGAARTPLNQLVQICNRPKVAAGLFSSGHLTGCAADLANSEAIDKNHVELGKLLNQYGMSFIPNEAKRKGDPNHIFLSAYIDPKKPQFAKQLKLSLFKALRQALNDADDNQKTMIDGTLVSCARSKDAIKNLNDATKDLKVMEEKLSKEVKDLQDNVNKKNQQFSDKVKEIAYELAKRDRKNGSLDRDRERQYFGDRDRSDKGGYWEKNTRQEYHDYQRDIHCYREVHENSRGDRFEARGCTGGGTREFSGGKQY